MRSLMIETMRVIADEFTVNDLITGLEGITFMGI